MSVTIEASITGAADIKSHHVVAYARNVWQRASYASKLTDTVMSDLNDTSTGTSWTDATYGRATVQNVTDEFAPHNTQRLNRGSRKADWQSKYLSHMVGALEKSEVITDPTSQIPKAHGDAVGWERDKNILAAMFAPVMQITNLGAPDPTNPEDHEVTMVNFPAGNIIPVDYNGWWHGMADGAAAPAAGPKGLTVGKLADGLRRMSEGELLGDPLCACSKRDLIHLSSSVPVGSSDFNQIQALINGTLNHFMGFDFVPVHAKTQVGYGTAAAEVAMYVKDAIIYKEQNLVQASIEPRADIHKNNEAYLRYKKSGMRREDSVVFKCIVDQS